MTGLRMMQRYGEAITVESDGVELFQYVYEPANPQLESPRPYFHPLRALDGRLVSVYRPHDHVWHKGISLALPNVDSAGLSANFWGGPTNVCDKGYQQLNNNGTQQHRAFANIECTDQCATFDEYLVWATEHGDSWLDERRQVAVTLLDDSWRLSFAAALRNITKSAIEFGSPTTKGRPLAGYGGLFWRGPRSFNRGQIFAAGGRSGPELMGEPADWLGYVGRHDGADGGATVVFVDSPDNPRYPTQWFVRDEPYACVCPAPFFDEKLELPAGEVLRLRYDVVIAHDEWDATRIDRLVAEQIRPVDPLSAPE